MGLCIAPHAKDMGEGSTSTLGARTEILLPSNPEEPSPILADEAVFAAWPRSPGFRAFWGWIQRRCERLKGKEIVRGDYGQSSKVAIRILASLISVCTSVDEVAG
jgi:serine/threonine-protein phosphatase 2A activator